MQETIERVNWLLHDSGITQLDIAKKTKISTSTISRIKNNNYTIKEMKFSNALKLDELAIKTLKL